MINFKSISQNTTKTHTQCNKAKQWKLFFTKHFKLLKSFSFHWILFDLFQISEIVFCFLCCSFFTFTLFIVVFCTQYVAILWGQAFIQEIKLMWISGKFQLKAFIFSFYISCILFYESFCVTSYCHEPVVITGSVLEANQTKFWRKKKSSALWDHDP